MVKSQDILANLYCLDEKLITYYTYNCSMIDN